MTTKCDCLSLTVVVVAQDFFSGSLVLDSSNIFSIARHVWKSNAKSSGPGVIPEVKTYTSPSHGLQKAISRTRIPRWAATPVGGDAWIDRLRHINDPLRFEARHMPAMYRDRV